MRIFTVSALLLSLIACPLAYGKTPDNSVKAKLDARKIHYEIDGEGDFKITYSYKKENRTQLVFVSGVTQTVAGLTIREIFSPAARIEKDGIDGAKALELLAESRDNKMGSWEIGGDVLYFVIKVPDPSAEDLEHFMDIVAESADTMELKLSGSRDDL